MKGNEVERAFENEVNCHDFYGGRKEAIE